MTDGDDPPGATPVTGRLAHTQLGLTAAEQRELTLDLLRRGQGIELRVGGACMRPWAFSGDWLRVEPLCGPARRGWVVLLRRECGELLAHRVTRVHGDRVFTRGDLSERADPPWPPERVLGRAVWSRGRLGLRLSLTHPALTTLGLGLSPVLRLGRRWWRRLRGGAARLGALRVAHR